MITWLTEHSEAVSNLFSGGCAVLTTVAGWIAYKARKIVQEAFEIKYEVENLKQNHCADISAIKDEIRHMREIGDHEKISTSKELNSLTRNIKEMSDKIDKLIETVSFLQGRIGQK